LKSCCVLQDHYDDERNKTVFHNTTPDLQDQDQDRFFWSQTGLVLRPMVSDHITGNRAKTPGRNPPPGHNVLFSCWHWCVVWVSATGCDTYRANTTVMTHSHDPPVCGPLWQTPPTRNVILASVEPTRRIGCCIKY